MRTVRLHEVIRRAQTRVNKDDTELEYYVGGEHFDSGEIDLNGRGTIASSTIGPMFYYGFKPGDFLLVSRNPHLKKAARVDFAGICPEKTFVLESNDPEVLLPDFLPWVLQNERFWDYAQRNRHGSTNFFLNWSSLAEYEFVLPDIAIQQKVASVLWAAQDLKRCYRRLLVASEQLVKSRFVEMFGDFQDNPLGWPELGFDEFATIDTHMTTDYRYYADYPHIGIDSIVSGTGELKGYRTVAEDNVISGKYPFTAEHIIYSKIRPNLNKVALPDFEGVCSADAYPILPKKEVCNRVFLAHVMRSDFFLNQILGFSTRSNMPKVNKSQLAHFRTPMPPLGMQLAFADFVSQVDKSEYL